MAYGVILQKGQKWYTDLNFVFQAAGNVQTNYSWLITDWECNQPVKELDCASQIRHETESRRYCWMSGDELTEMIQKYKNLQFIWGVFSGLPKTISKEQALSCPLPCADSDLFWKNPVFLQHPLAELEIVPQDSSLVLFLAKERKLAEEFYRKCPASEDLWKYNTRHLIQDSVSFGTPCGKISSLPADFDQNLQNNSDSCFISHILKRKA